MIKIHLIRHGQKESHPGDPALTDLGILQAQHIGEQLNLDFSTDDALKERMNWEHELIPKENFLTEWTKATQERSYNPKWGDSSNSTGERIHELVKNLEVEKPQHIVLVSHGGAIVDFLRSIFDDDAVAQLEKQYPEGVDYQMLNCSINTVKLGKEQVIELLDYVDHLDSSTEH